MASLSMVALSLGLDSHTPEIFNQVYEFAMRAELWEVQITVLTPFPGTPLYDRLLIENRILQPGRWDLCTLFDVNFQPAQMSVQQLREGIALASAKLYTAEAISASSTQFSQQS